MNVNRTHCNFAKKNKKDKVFKTISPSMDIQIASNFERLLFDVNNYNGEKVNKLMEQFKKEDLIKVD